MSSEASGRWAAVATTVAALPVVVAGIRAAAGDWVPIGDQAYFTVRSRDVLTGHHPLVGAFSSASVDLTRPVNNLGPLQLDLLAPFTKVAPWGGTALGVAAVHVAAIVTIAWLIARLATPRAVVPAMAATALLTWTMGSNRLVSPVQHPYLVLPFVCLLVAVWASLAGDRWAPVVVVAAGSLCLQTHLSYAVLVSALAVAVVAARVRSAGRADVRGPWVTAAVVATLLWVQPLIDQIGGTHNASDVVRSAFGGGSDAGGHPGFGTALRIVAGTLAAPGRYVRGGFAPMSESAPTAGWFAVSLLVLVWVAVVALAVLAWRRGRRTVAAGVTTWAVAVLAGVLTAWRLPITLFDLPVTNYRWLWGLGTFGLLAVAVAADRWWPQVRHVWWLPLGVLTLVNLPSGPHEAPDEAAAVDVVAAFVDGLEHGDLLAAVDGPLLFDDSHLYFGHPYNYPAMAVLQSRGIDLHFTHEYHVRRFGEGRRADGHEVATLVLYHADEARALAGQPGALVVELGDRAVAATLEYP